MERKLWGMMMERAAGTGRAESPATPLPWSQTSGYSRTAVVTLCSAVQSRPPGGPGASSSVVEGGPSQVPPPQSVGVRALGFQGMWLLGAARVSIPCPTGWLLVSNGCRLSRFWG